MRADELSRLLSRINFTPGGCWEYTGHVDRHGYGRARAGGKNLTASRASYILHKGVVPLGFHVDHLCRNTKCVNPDHLEAVTPRESTLRGISFAAVNARKTACTHGHAFDQRNTYRQGGKRRQCRRCNAAAVHRYKHRRTSLMRASATNNQEAVKHG